MDLPHYYAQICRIPLLSKEEEESLFAIRNSPTASELDKKKAGDRLVEANLRFVFKTAKGYSRRAPDLFPELIAAGNEGLLVALNKYDISKKFRFLTYAGCWIEQRILNCMSKQRIVALPVRRQQIASKIEKITSSNPDVTTEDLMKALPDVSERDIRELRATSFLTFYIEDMGDSDPEFEIDPIGTEVDRRLDMERVQAVIKSLPSKEYQVIDLLFGFSSSNGDQMRIPDVAKALGITKDEVKAHRDKAFSSIEVILGVNPFSE